MWTATRRTHTQIHRAFAWSKSTYESVPTELKKSNSVQETNNRKTISTRNGKIDEIELDLMQVIGICPRTNHRNKKRRREKIEEASRFDFAFALFHRNRWRCGMDVKQWILHKSSRSLRCHSASQIQIQCMTVPESRLARHHYHFSSIRFSKPSTKHKSVFTIYLRGWSEPLCLRLESNTLFLFDSGEFCMKNSAQYSGMNVKACVVVPILFKIFFVSRFGTSVRSLFDLALLYVNLSPIHLKSLAYRWCGRFFFFHESEQSVILASKKSGTKT